LNIEPIAFVTGANKFDPVMVDTVLKVGTPLYTHPADLTDEEIDNLIADVAEKPTDEDLYDFAKAILKKAQEK
jgi:hypothetical protein